MKSDDSDHVITIGQYLLFYKSIPLGCDMGATHGITLPFDWAVFWGHKKNFLPQGLWTENLTGNRAQHIKPNEHWPFKFCNTEPL